MTKQRGLLYRWSLCGHVPHQVYCNMERGQVSGDTEAVSEERRKGRQSKGSSQNRVHLPDTPEEPWSQVISDTVTKREDRGLERHQTAEPIKHTEEQVEVIKFYLESRRPAGEGHRESVKMLTDEVSQIQEVRYCLKTLRAQMEARKNQNHHHHKKNPATDVTDLVSNHKPPLPNGEPAQHDSENLVNRHQEESVTLSEATKRLYVQLTEAEDRHQEERDRLKAENSTLQRRLEEQTARLQRAEGLSEDRGQRVEGLERLLGSLAVESSGLKEKVAAGETELGRLREQTQQGREEQHRSEALEKELANMKEKIHQLDDMLKSQQRKVRHMIEQLQNSRTVIQERDRIIVELEEKVAYLEAENREMHDRMEYISGSPDPPPPELTESEDRQQVVYSKVLTPSTHRSSKNLPYIKVIEIKS
ncbi:tuftelin 1b isoform X2 [Gadus macrocephalus]|uniref:tuftelin 1b isoform X2 n=1 Tax=Gadus macrocephalus TaxID=80720 RepID=UPI0028CBB045|nr:tuftelin 1b isoform X2 [Gadus macrocephalus]